MLQNEREMLVAISRAKRTAAQNSGCQVADLNHNPRSGSDDSLGNYAHPKRDAYVCPAGKLLTPIRYGRLRDLTRIDYGEPKACRDCFLRARCTNDVRLISSLENEDALDRMAERLKARPEILDRCREVVEHPFGSIEQWMYQGAS